MEAIIIMFSSFYYLLFNGVVHVYAFIKAA